MIAIFTAIGGSMERAPWGWALFVIVLVALIKVWPVLQLQAIDAKARLRTEKRTDLKDCRQRIDEMSNDMEALRERVHGLEMKLVGAIAAYRILDVELEARDPGCSALGAARAAMSAAFTLSPSTPGAPADQKVDAPKTH